MPQDRDGYCYDVKEGLPWRSILFFLVGEITALYVVDVVAHSLDDGGALS